MIISWVGHEAHIEPMRLQILVGKLIERDHLEDLCIVQRIILK